MLALCSIGDSLMIMVEWYGEGETEVCTSIQVCNSKKGYAALCTHMSNEIQDSKQCILRCSKISFTKEFFTLKLTHVLKVHVWMCSLLTHATKVRPSLRRFSLYLHMLKPITCGSPKGPPNSTHVSETKRGRQDRNYFTPLSKVGRHLSLHRCSRNSPLLKRIGQIYDICLSDPSRQMQSAGWNALMSI